MYWFKHHTNFRDSKPMRMIQRCLGLEGVAVAYKLLEIGAENCNKATEYSSTLILEPPMTKEMLARDLLPPTLEDEQMGFDLPTAKDLIGYLDVFEEAGLIVLGSETMRGSTVKDGKRVLCPVTFETIRFVGLEELMDEYTEKSRRKAQKEAEKADKKKSR
jgi:hypothetical protein